MTMRDRVKELRRVPASELRANPKNWRRHPPSQEAALRGVLEDIGFADAVIARETDDGLELIDGHLRQEVMGDQSIPVLIVDVTEEEADKMLLTLDPLAMMAHADTDQLLQLLRDTQFESKAVNDMLEAVANGERLPMPDLTEPVEDPGPQIDRADELREKWQTERGQVWEVGRHRLMCGDILEGWPFPVPGLVLADPPYGLGGYAGRSGKKEAVRGDNNDVAPLLRAIPLALIRVIWCEWRTYPYFVEVLGEPQALIVWAKPWPGMGRGYRRKHEFACFYGSYNATDEYDLWTIDYKSEGINSTWQRTAQHDVHPTQKPVELFARSMRNHSGDIADPFLGSGTTMVAAEQLGRICYGMEIEPKYVAVALERMAGMGLEPKLVTG